MYRTARIAREDVTYPSARFTLNVNPGAFYGVNLGIREQQYLLGGYHIDVTIITRNQENSRCCSLTVNFSDIGRQCVNIGYLTRINTVIAGRNIWPVELENPSTCIGNVGSHYITVIGVESAIRVPDIESRFTVELIMITDNSNLAIVCRVYILQCLHTDYVIGYFRLGVVACVVIPDELVNRVAVLVIALERINPDIGKTVGKDCLFRSSFNVEYYRVRSDYVFIVCVGIYIQRVIAYRVQDFDLTLYERAYIDIHEYVVL